MLSFYLVYMSFQVTGNSTTCFDVLGSAFGLLALNEYNLLASEFYLLFIDSFHSEVYRDDDYMLLKVTASQAKSCYIWTVLTLIIALWPH